MRKVSFVLRCADTREGLHVVVVGGCEALGNWQTVDAVSLGTSAMEFPTWRSTKDIEIAEAEVVEYKYVICGNDGNAVRWEERPNRTMRISALVESGVLSGSPSPITIHESFNHGDENDDCRFRATGSVIRRTSFTRTESGGPVSTDQERPGGDDGEFSKTIRERLPSRSSFSHVQPCVPGPTSHVSYSLLPDIAPEVTGGKEQEDDPEPEASDVGGDAGAAPTAGSGSGSGPLGGMVREESGSNLFMLDEVDQEEAIEPLEFEDRYSLIGNGPLGEGTFGLVWRCKPKQANANPEVSGEEEAERAAKIVRKARLKPHEMRYLLGEGGEVMTHIKMKHPHIVELFEYFDEVHTVTLVLECCRGGDLFDAVVRQSRATGRGLPEPAALVATRHVLLALEHLHRHAIVHRDIKCENILLAKAGTPFEENIFKLCDFGFARVDKGDGLSDRLGSPDTVAPEVVIGARYSTPADLWSAGVLLYMMLNARPPFYASSDSEVLKKVRAGNYSLSGSIWDSISDPPKNLIRALMTVDAGSRLSATEALRASWFQEAAVPAP